MALLDLLEDRMLETMLGRLLGRTNLVVSWLTSLVGRYFSRRATELDI